MIDPDILKIKYNINEKTQHDLLAYIYVRFANFLIQFPIQNNRTLNSISIKKAEQLNKLLPAFKPKSGYNKKFYIDNIRKSPAPPFSGNSTNINDYLGIMFKSPRFIKTVSKLYDINVYNWLLKFNTGILSIEKIIEDLSLNEKNQKYYQKKKKPKSKKYIFKFLYK